MPLPFQDREVRNRRNLARFNSNEARQRTRLAKLQSYILNNEFQKLEALLIKHPGLLKAAAAQNIHLLHLAAKHSANAIPLLVFNGDINVKDSEGQTALHIAASEGGIASVRLLLVNNAEPDIRNNKGQTPLHVAAEKGNTYGIYMLVGFSKEINAKDNEGKTPLSIAATQGNREATRVLLSYASRLPSQEERFPTETQALLDVVWAATGRLKKIALEQPELLPDVLEIKEALPQVVLRELAIEGDATAFSGLWQALPLHHKKPVDMEGSALPTHFLTNIPSDVRFKNLSVVEAIRERNAQPQERVTTDILQRLQGELRQKLAHSSDASGPWQQRITGEQAKEEMRTR